MTGPGNKRLIFIVSGGRTGTKFFAVQLGRLLQNVVAVHEPDALSTNPRELAGRIRQFGFRHMIIDRLRGQSGIRQLGEAFLCGEVSESEAIERIRAAREAYYAAIKEPAVVESYYAWYGLVPLLDAAFGNARVLSVVRDPRDWVRSQMNWGTQYGRRDWAYRLGFSKLDPGRLGDQAFATAWDGMDRFGRLCWLWRTIYTALNDARRLPWVRTERFEDLFVDHQDLSRLESTLQFLLDGVEDVPGLESAFVRERIHGNVAYSFPGWREWTPARARQLDEICGPLMQDFGYGHEPAWAEQVAR